MGILKQLAEKPWETEGDNIIDLQQGSVARAPHAKVALSWLLASLSVVFALISIGYTYRLTLPDWIALKDPSFLWFNTIVLLLSSIFLEQARKSARKGSIRDITKAMIIGGILTLIFLCGQYWVSYNLSQQGYYASTNPANAFFYMITWLHALHLFGGLIAWVRTMKRIARNDEMFKIALSAELCAIYWHFLFIVWVAFFILMVFS